MKVNINVILNFYSSIDEAKLAFNKFTETSNIIIGYRKDLKVYTETSVVYFRWFNTYDNAKTDSLSGQYSEINFYVDLPEQVKSHYLSRIRLPNN